jgi:hypothetical protein
MGLVRATAISLSARSLALILTVAAVALQTDNHRPGDCNLELLPPGNSSAQRKKFYSMPESHFSIRKSRVH